MAAQIEVRANRKGAGWECQVTVSEAGGRTGIAVDRGYKLSLPADDDGSDEKRARKAPWGAVRGTVRI